MLLTSNAVYTVLVFRRMRYNLGNAFITGQPFHRCYGNQKFQIEKSEQNWL